MSIDVQKGEEEARILRLAGTSCSETTVLAVSHAAGCVLDDETLRSLAVGFRGGIGATFDEGTCGALSGAIMATGLAMGSDRKGATRAAKEMYGKFKDHFGTVCCGKQNRGRDHCLNCCLVATRNALEILNAREWARSNSKKTD